MPGDAFVAQPIVGFGIQAIFCVPSSSNTASPVARSRIGIPIYQAHAAITRNRELRVVTIMWHLFTLTDHLHSFDDVGPFRNFDILTINVDGHVFDYAIDLHV